MAIRLPLQTILDYNDVNEVGAGSVAGGVAKTFNLPQDTDNVVLKLTASVVGGGVSALFQTSDDGGTTWYAVARTSIVSNANNDKPEFLSFPVIGTGVKTTTVAGTVPSVGGQAASSIYAATGQVTSALGQLQVTGLPVMGVQNRVFLQYTSGVSANALSRVKVMVNSQSASHN